MLIWRIAHFIHALTGGMWGGKIEKIGKSAFAQNKNLTTVSIPNSVTEIEYGAFAGCENLSDIREFLIRSRQSVVCI